MTFLYCVSSCWQLLLFIHTFFVLFPLSPKKVAGRKSHADVLMGTLHVVASHLLPKPGLPASCLKAPASRMCFNLFLGWVI